MKRIAIWVSALVSITVAAAATAAPLISRLVRDPENRFTISVPAGWDVHTSASARAPAVTAQSPAASGQLPDSVDVITRDLPVALSPQGCADQATLVMRYVIHRWTTVHEGPATMAGLPAYSRVYTWQTSTGQDRRSVQTCVTLERRAFVIVGTTANTQAGAQQALPQLEQIMATFRPNTVNLPAMDQPVSPHSQGGQK